MNDKLTRGIILIILAAGFAPISIFAFINLFLINSIGDSFGEVITGIVLVIFFVMPVVLTPLILLYGGVKAIFSYFKDRDSIQ